MWQNSLLSLLCFQQRNRFDAKSNVPSQPGDEYLVVYVDCCSDCSASRAWDGLAVGYDAGAGVPANLNSKRTGCTLNAEHLIPITNNVMLLMIQNT